ncbi:helix-turn-helix domain protein [Ruminiclostridium hungatei]|uniref:Helix-turn-helix domain protein n=1 Tax=Ruminiclostridium hungatei TaxID=48256 RepID=A0A1V4SM51_RUMHU|nr:AraC family transcriptional regulator [Ruminiclostridium hungatei]OPX44555.1 helix-turn-helix domain protein [Ruminiclostridium hungatei]
MFTLNSIYRPITAQPFLNDESYTELQPCEALKPYICCFWVTQKPHSGLTSTEMKDKLVIPDTCMDIIFNINMDKNELEGLFAGISDTTFMDKAKNVSPLMSCFAIRFYSWAVPLFSDESMKYVFNSFVDVETYFTNLKHDLHGILTGNLLIPDTVDKVEKYLLKRIDSGRQNNNVMNAVYKVLKSKGTSNISELAGFTAVSQRQLERLFLEYVGVSPKKLSGLIRYQYLWQDIMLDRKFNIQDAVCKYGYTDQAHLLNDFRKYHTMSLMDARRFAYKTR